ncbi:MAG: Holliday junction branch migration protein RuvA [Flavobacteriaceae bacterium]|nr:Holliday junction branch migration protein RuvA [Flavobacteriaceae bacterium]
MYSFLKGIIVGNSPTSVVMECNGIGYELQTSLHTSSQIKVDKHQPCLLHTYLQVREDSHTLFGFLSKFEKEIFKLLITVSGISGSTARNILSSLTPNDVHQAIINQDLHTIKSCKGIGLKTAQRLCIELKDKMMRLSSTDKSSISTVGNQKDEVIRALEVLGYSKRISEQIVVQIIAKESQDYDISSLLKKALNQLQAR